MRSSSDFRAIPAANAASDLLMSLPRESAQAGSRCVHVDVTGAARMIESMWGSINHLRSSSHKY